MRATTLTSMCAMAAMALSALPAAAGDGDRWSGFYVGGHIGRTWSNTSWNWDIPDNALVPEQTTYTSAWQQNKTAGGVQVGYQYRFGNFVPGIEFSYTGHNSEGTTSITDTTDTRILTGKVGNILATTARLGIAQDRWMGYAKGGLAWSDIELGSTRLSDGAQQTLSSGVSRGFIYGGGVEYSFDHNISLGAEYTYAQFHVERGGVEDIGTTTASSHMSDPSVKSLMLRLNYRFGRPPF